MPAPSSATSTTGAGGSSTRNQIPEFMMSMLHSGIVHQVALATFQQQQQNSSNTTDKSPSSSPDHQQQKQIPLICTTAEKATEFYHRLETLGFTIGLRISERLLSGASSSSSTPVGGAGSSSQMNQSFDRPQDEAIHLIRTVLWPALFGKEVAREADPAAAASLQQQAGKEITNLVYKLIDTDFSWTRSVALPPDSASLADPFMRGTQYDLIEDAATFAQGIKKNEPTENIDNNNKNHPQQQQQPRKLITGPNDYVVFLTGMILGFLSSLGFGSHAERRVFGGDRATVSAQTTAMQQQHLSNVSSNTATPTERNNNNNNIHLSNSSSTSAVISRAPTSFVTVRHRLLSRDGEPVRPSGMQLKLVVHFS